MENENHLLLIVILLLAVAAFVIGDSSIRSSEKPETVEATSASQSSIIGH